jgi:hypothetical protein
MADNIINVTKYLNNTKASDISSQSNGVFYSFGFTKISNDTAIVIEGVCPNWYNWNDGAYMYVEIDGQRKYTGVLENPNLNASLDQSAAIKQTWYGLTAGKKTVTFGWSAIDGSANRPWHTTHPNSSEDARNPQTGSEWIVWEVKRTEVIYGTVLNPYDYANQALSANINYGISYFRTSATTSRRLRWYRFSHGSEERIWVLVVCRNKNASDLFTTNAVNATLCDTSNHFKLSDSEIEYMTNRSINPQRYGLAYFPAVSSNTSTVIHRELFTTSQCNVWRTVEHVRDAAGITIGFSTTDASSLSPALRGCGVRDFSKSLPVDVKGISDSNSYCGGSQILSNWDDSGQEMWSARFNSAGGCSYCGENSGAYQDANGITSGGNYEGWVHCLLIS